MLVVGTTPKANEFGEKRASVHSPKTVSKVVAQSLSNVLLNSSTNEFILKHPRLPESNQSARDLQKPVSKTVNQVKSEITTETLQQDDQSKSSRKQHMRFKKPTIKTKITNKEVQIEQHRSRSQIQKVDFKIDVESKSKYKNSVREDADSENSPFLPAMKLNILQYNQLKEQAMLPSSIHDYYRSYQEEDRD